MRNIASEFWKFVESQDNDLSKRVYNWLNKDNLSAIIVDRGVFWIELTTSMSTLPKYVFQYIEKWCKSKGLRYLYSERQV